MSTFLTSSMVKNPSVSEFDIFGVHNFTDYFLWLVN